MRGCRKPVAKAWTCMLTGTVGVSPEFQPRAGNTFMTDEALLDLSSSPPRMQSVPLKQSGESGLAPERKQIYAQRVIPHAAKVRSHLQEP